MALPKEVCDQLETAIANLLDAMKDDGGGHIAPEGRVPAGSRIYFRSWVIPYLIQVLEYGRGKRRAGWMVLARYPEQKRRLSEEDLKTWRGNP